MRTKVVVPLVLAVVVATVAVHAQTCAPMSTSTYQEASATDFCGATSRVLPYDQVRPFFVSLFNPTKINK